MIGGGLLVLRILRLGFGGFFGSGVRRGALYAGQGEDGLLFFDSWLAGFLVFVGLLLVLRLFLWMGSVVEHGFAVGDQSVGRPGIGEEEHQSEVVVNDLLAGTHCEAQVRMGVLLDLANEVVDDVLGGSTAGMPQQDAQDVGRGVVGWGLVGVGGGLVMVVVGCRVLGCPDYVVAEVDGCGLHCWG